MAGQLFDNHGRHINYLRLAVTDRCNLRCFYCMPEEGIDYVARKQLLSYEEMVRIVSVLVPLGISKIRLTGGEPFLRRDFMDFLRNISRLEGLEQINLTTNGTLTEQHIPELKAMGIHSVNLSIDTLDRQRFYDITRRDSLPQVWSTFEALLDAGIPTKLNAVVMDGRNIEDILPMVELTERYPVSVRFIEEMPFNGDVAHYQ
ncbi:MAG: radical SAM protein, partial [Bacteroidota bacterium]